MEKNARERLVDAALDLLARQGAGAVTIRSVENAAGATHGTVRHHFGDLAGLRTALVAALVEAELSPAGGAELTDHPDRVAALVSHWTGAGAAIGVDRPEASVLVAMLDGVVLDALVRDTPADLGPWRAALDRAVGSTNR